MQVIQQAAVEAPHLLSAFSPSSMDRQRCHGIAFADSADGKLYFTVANLNNKLHRSFRRRRRPRRILAAPPLPMRPVLATTTRWRSMAI